MSFWKNVPYVSMPYEKALPQDDRYRDLCVAGAPLSPFRFDPLTGQLLGENNLARPDSVYDTPPDSEAGSYPDSVIDDWSKFGMDSAADAPADTPPSIFDIPYVGNLNQARPPLNGSDPQCMPMKDTPKVSLGNSNYNSPYTANTAFTYYLNANDRPYFNNDAGTDPYKRTNFYKNKTFFIGDLGCPDILSFAGDSPADSPASGGGANDCPPSSLTCTADTIPLRADLWRARAENCYNYYILGHTPPAGPVFVSDSASDSPGADSAPPKPETLIHGPGPNYVMERPGIATSDPLSQMNPNRAIENSCQPLVNGKDARILKFHPQAENKFGFAPVQQYTNRPDMDEAEYILSTYLTRSWNNNFSTSKTVPTPYPLDARFQLSQVLPSKIPRVDMPCVKGTVSSFSPASTNNYQAPVPVCDCDLPYSQLMFQPDYQYSSPSKYAPDKADGYYCPNVEKIVDPTGPFSPRNDTTGMTDRDFSTYSSTEYPSPNSCSSTKKFGYTNWNNSKVPATGDNDHLKYPVVQCGIVPVDVLSFRDPAFQACMRNRLEYNKGKWMEAGFPDPPSLKDAYQGNYGAWTPPCATRYWEQDSPDVCKVSMSIQQCCHIIIKDVVPTNFLKMRTCEGLLQKRRDDKKLQSDLKSLISSPADSAGDSMAEAAPFTHITDDDVGIWGYSSYMKAITATRKLNADRCADNEPSEYRFDTWNNTPSTYNVDSADDPNPADQKYLGVRMPYMRWWDTGVSAGNPRHGGSFTNTLGSFDTIIGVGREERDKQAAKEASKIAEDNDAPAFDINRLKTTHPAEMGRFGGWAELKAHQMWTTRRNNEVCIGRYEKLFKYGGPEDLVLAKGGAGYTSRTSVQWPWALGWRGYATDTHGYAFPSLYHGGWNVMGGLDKVAEGDIISYNINGIPQLYYVVGLGGWAKQGNDIPITLPGGGSIQAEFCSDDGTYYQNATKADPCANKSTPLHPTRIFVVGWDQGKFPTSTGASVSWGMGPERTIFKSRVPVYESNNICGMKLRALTMAGGSDADSTCLSNDNDLDAATCQTSHCQPSCADPEYPSCVLPLGTFGWDSVFIYRQSMDVLQCPGIATFDGGAAKFGGATLNLADTYNIWNGSGPRPASVISQNMTNQVDTNLWAFCSNGGYDPPRHFARGYSGAGTGADTKTNICGPEWHYSVKKPADPKTDEEKEAYPALMAAFIQAQQSGCSAATEKYEWFPALPPAPPPAPILGCKLYPMQYQATYNLIPCGSPYYNGSCFQPIVYDYLNWNAIKLFIASTYHTTLPANAYLDRKTGTGVMTPISSFPVMVNWCDASIPP